MDALRQGGQDQRAEFMMQLKSATGDKDEHVRSYVADALACEFLDEMPVEVMSALRSQIQQYKKIGLNKGEAEHYMTSLDEYARASAIKREGRVSAVHALPS